MPTHALRKFALPMLMAGAVMGCQPVWIKDGERSGEFADAVYECNAPKRIGYGGGDIVNEMNRRAVLGRCIASYGFKQVDPHNVPAGAESHPDVAPGVRPYRG